MESGGLLKPMAADALLRRPHQQAGAQPRPVAFLAPERDSEALHAPAFAPKPEKKIDPGTELDALLSAFVQEDEDDEPLEDAVPTASMPVPVCVPLYELDAPKKRRLWWIAPLVLVITAIAGYALWKMDYLPTEVLNKFNIPSWVVDLLP